MKKLRMVEGYFCLALFAARMQVSCICSKTGLLYAVTEGYWLSSYSKRKPALAR